MPDYLLPAGPPANVRFTGAKRNRWELRADPAERFRLIFGRYATADEVRQMPDPGCYYREADYLSALETWLRSDRTGAFFDNPLRGKIWTGPNSAAS